MIGWWLDWRERRRKLRADYEAQRAWEDGWRAAPLDTTPVRRAVWRAMANKACRSCGGSGIDGVDGKECACTRSPRAMHPEETLRMPADDQAHAAMMGGLVPSWSEASGNPRAQEYVPESPTCTAPDCVPGCDAPSDGGGSGD